MTRLELNVLSWLNFREEMPSPRDLCSEFPDNQEPTLLRVMEKLVKLGFAEQRGDLWTSAPEMQLTSERFYMRVMTKFGNDVHLTEVESRNRQVNIVGLRTLCGNTAGVSMDGLGDKLSCRQCAKRERFHPKRRRAGDKGGLVAPWSKRKMWAAETLK